MKLSRAFPVYATLASVILGVAVLGVVLSWDSPGRAQAASALTQRATVPGLASDSASGTVAVPPTPTATAPATGTPTPSALDGAWDGTWQNVTPGNDSGAFEVTLKQAGQQLTGTIKVLDSICITTATVTGTVSGRDIRFGAVAGAVTIVYTGTWADNEMSGTFEASDTCYDATGTWSARKR